MVIMKLEIQCTREGWWVINYTCYHLKYKSTTSAAGLDPRAADPDGHVTIHGRNIAHCDKVLLFLTHGQDIFITMKTEWHDG